MLRLDEYAKQHQQQQQHPASSPSISSPDSHNSDSSIEIGDKRNSLLSSKQSNNKQHVPNTQSQLLHQAQQQQQQQQQPSPLALNKDLFLPLPFAGFPLMPPPGFLPPPTHFLFSSYHNALYEQNHHLLQQQVQQGLLKTATDLPTNAMISQKSPSIERDIENRSNGSSELRENNNNNNNSNSHNNNKKRHYTETLLDMQRKHLSSLSSSVVAKIPKRSNSPAPALHMINSHHHLNHHHLSNSNRICKSEDEEEDIDMNNESDEVLTPPRSPKTPMLSIVENNPIDLSMKSGSSTKSDDINHNYYKTKTNNNNNNSSSKSPSDNFTMNGNSDSDSNDHHHTTNGINNSNNNRKTIHCHALKDGSKHKQQMNGGSDESGEDDDDDYRHLKHNNNHQYDDRSTEFEVELKRRKLHLAAPLDLTTKV